MSQIKVRTSSIIQDTVVHDLNISNKNKINTVAATVIVASKKSSENTTDSIEKETSQKVDTNSFVSEEGCLTKTDTQKLEDNIKKNKSATVPTLSTSQRVVLRYLPLYFGTNEKEFTEFRKNSLLKRRLHKNPDYPDGKEKCLTNGPHLRIPNSGAVIHPYLASKEFSSPILINTAIRKRIETPSAGKNEHCDSKQNSNGESNVKGGETTKTKDTSYNSKSKNTSKGEEHSNIDKLDDVVATKIGVEQSTEIASMQPLGVISLKIMFQPNYFSSVIANQKSNLVTPHGLINTSSICYMNSVLQMLFECEPFSQVLNIIRNSTMGSIGESKMPLVDALLMLQDLFKKKRIPAKSITSTVIPRRDSIDPMPFYTAIKKLDRFSNLEWGRQEDAEEFLGYLLDGLHEEFITSIEDMPLSAAQNFENGLTDPVAVEKVRYAVTSIKNSKGKGCGTEERQEPDGHEWNEVSANRKISVKRSFEFKPSPIALLFGGQFRSVLQPSNTKKSSVTLDPFMHIQLDISDATTSTLEGAFEKFSEIEKITFGNQSARKQNLIDKLPMILIIHLKRFSFVKRDQSENEADAYEIVSSKQKKRKHLKQTKEQELMLSDFKGASEGHIEKISKPIAYKAKLTLPSSCISTSIEGNPTYKLVGVIYHHGRSAEGGHYTVDVLEPTGGWIHIDDTLITHITEGDVLENGIKGGDLTNNSKSAYLLMYQRL
ncbi:hypothetical protein HII12_001530 [Brettanomyces bruxellensis]|uniref:ubiquitinyl hydrolase 1 n=1 Tax=Dekkera bruxellensis TaxID=5007 RepID=A0A8H6EXK2_DEKBR|nr:hypothetical protein HII12_001530 [Brettanomyces bruxellensis]